MENRLVKPLGDRVLLKENQKEEKTASGIIIPDTVAKEDVKTAKVISVGPGLYTQAGSLIPMNVVVGDEVIVPPYHQGQEIKLNGEKYTLLRESEILMVIR